MYTHVQTPARNGNWSVCVKIYLLLVWGNGLHQNLYIIIRIIESAMPQNWCPWLITLKKPA